MQAREGGREGGGYGGHTIHQERYRQPFNASRWGDHMGFSWTLAIKRNTVNYCVAVEK
jgi:hypothetical protein